MDRPPNTRRTSSPPESRTEPEPVATVLVSVPSVLPIMSSAPHASHDWVSRCSSDYARE